MKPLLYGDEDAKELEQIAKRLARIAKLMLGSKKEALQLEKEKLARFLIERRWFLDVALYLAFGDAEDPPNSKLEADVHRARQLATAEKENSHERFLRLEKALSAHPNFRQLSDEEKRAYLEPQGLWPPLPSK